MSLRVEVEQEEDGRWIAEIPELPGVMAYGATEGEALRKVWKLAGRVLSERVKELQAEGKLPTEPTDEQRIDWAYGNTVIENPDITREMVAEIVSKLPRGKP